MYVGGNAVEINAEAADSNDYKSTTGIFIFVSDFTQCPEKSKLFDI